MSVDRSFLTLGLDIAEQALLDVIARDNLHLRPEKMPRRRRARANGRLKQIEHIVRRLLTLMALSLHIVFAPPRQRAPPRRGQVSRRARLRSPPPQSPPQ